MDAVELLPLAYGVTRQESNSDACKLTGRYNQDSMLSFICCLFLSPWQVSELRARLSSARDTNEHLGKELGEKEASVRQLEGRLMEYKEQMDSA